MFLQSHSKKMKKVAVSMYIEEMEGLPLPKAKPAWIIGNGKSLTPKALDKLKGQTCFAVNRINLMYDKTEWRPDYYVRAESAQDIETDNWLPDVAYHLNNPNIETWCNVWFAKWLERNGYETLKKPNTIKSCAHYTKNFDNQNAPHLLHLPLLCTFGGSLHVAIQIAMNYGYAPLYLVGCDLGYSDGQQNHFAKDYQNGKEQPARYANGNATAAHFQIARSGYPIYNATDGGNLDAYPRISFEDALCACG